MPKNMKDVLISHKNNHFTVILTVTHACMCCKKLHTISFLYPILFGSLWYLANKHKLPHWCFAAEQASCSWRDLRRQMGDLQMLEEQGAELAMAHLGEISIHHRLLIFIKVAAMVSLLCCQSELRVSRERQCHNSCFDWEPHSEDAVLSRLSIAINCQSFYFVDFANIFMYAAIASFFCVMLFG